MNNIIDKNNIYQSLKDSYLSTRNKHRATHYIIRRRSPGAGFFSNWFYVLNHMHLAHKYNLIPIVDMKYYSTLYSTNNNNIWDILYKQDSIDTVRNNNYYVASLFIMPDNIFYNNDRSYTTVEYNFNTFNDIYYNYIYYNNNYNRIINNINTNKNTLGIHYRGTDKLYYNPYHNINTNIYKYYDIIDEYIRKYKINQIYLATDQQDVYEIIKIRYGDIMIKTNHVRSEMKYRPIHKQNKINTNKHLFELIKDMESLRNCGYLIHGHSNLSNAAILLNNDAYLDRTLISS